MAAVGVRRETAAQIRSAAMQTSYVVAAAPDHPHPLVPALRVPENDRTASIALLDSVRRQGHHFGYVFRWRQGRPSPSQRRRWRAGMN